MTIESHQPFADVAVHPVNRRRDLRQQTLSSKVSTGRIIAAMLALGQVCFGATTTGAIAQQSAVTGSEDAMPERSKSSSTAADFAEEAFLRTPEMTRWVARFNLHIRQFVRHPGAVAKRQEPLSSLISFKVDQGGRLSGIRLEKSSGLSGVDEAVLTAFRQASPVPALPPGSPINEIEFTVPVVFRTDLTSQLSVTECSTTPSQCPITPPLISVKEADDRLPLSTTDRTALQIQISDCLKLAASKRVTLRLRLNREGALDAPPRVDSKTDQASVAAAAGADLMKCKPFRLTAENYESWREIVVTHEPGLPNTKTSVRAAKSQSR